VRLSRRSERSLGPIGLNEGLKESQEVLDSALDAPVVMCPVCETRAAAPPVERYGEYTLHGCPNCQLTFSDPMLAADSTFYETNAEYQDRWEFHLVTDRLAALGLKGPS
jgi:hypothetical protein